METGRIEIKQLNLRMPKKLVEELKILAIKNGKTLSYYVQEVLTIWVRNSTER